MLKGVHGGSCRQLHLPLTPALVSTTGGLSVTQETRPGGHQRIAPMIEERRATIRALGAVGIGMSERGLGPGVGITVLRGPVAKSAAEAVDCVLATTVGSENLR